MLEASEKFYLVTFWAFVIVIVVMLVWYAYPRADKANMAQCASPLVVAPTPETILRPPSIDGSPWRGDPPKYFPHAKWNEFGDNPDMSLGYKAMGMEFMLDREDGTHGGDEYDERKATKPDDKMPAMWVVDEIEPELAPDYTPSLTIGPGLATFGDEGF